MFYKILIEYRFEIKYNELYFNDFLKMYFMIYCVLFLKKILLICDMDYFINME